MVNVIIKTSTTRQSKVFEPTTTPSEVFQSCGLNSDGVSVRLDGSPLSNADLSKSLEELGVEDGSTATLTSIVKADGANK